MARKVTKRSSSKKAGAKGRDDEVRTTLSIRGAFGRRLNEIAREAGLTPLRLIHQWIEEGVEVAERARAEATATQRSATAESRDLLGLLRGLRNPYQQLVGAWRMARTSSQIAAVSGYHLELDAWNAEDYLLRVLRDLVDEFNASDEMLIVSNASFWNAADSPDAASPFGHDSATRYLGALQQAIHRGMGLSRVLLLSEEELRTRRGILAQQRQFLAEMAGTDASRVEVRCHVYSSNDVLAAARRSLGHFAMIRRRSEPVISVPSRDPDEGALIVEPVYMDSQPDRIVRLRFRFSRGRGNEDRIFKEYLNQFFQAHSGATSIAEMDHPSAS